MLRKLAAGLFRLKGIDLKLSHELAAAIYPSLVDAPEIDLKKVAEEALTRFEASFGSTSFYVGDLYDASLHLFQDGTAEEMFRDVAVRVQIEGDAPALIAFPGPTPIATRLVIVIPLGRLLHILNSGGYLRRNFVVTVENIRDGIRMVVAHELRHAADYVLNRKNLKPAGFETNSTPGQIQDRNERSRIYLNHPSELKSHAGDLAKFLFRAFQGDITKFRDSAGLQEALSRSNIWKYVDASNRKKFLQRVVAEFKNLVESGYGTETIPPGPVIDPYRRLRQFAARFSTATEFANVLVPRWKHIKERYDSAKAEKRVLHYTEKQEYRYTKDRFEAFRKAFKSLLAGEIPASLPRDEIPNSFQ